MSVKNGRDYIYLIWKAPQSRKQFIVGQLSKNGLFEFCYGFEVDEAIKEGFSPLISFEELGKTYKSDILFPVFSSRLPDSKRTGIEKILQKYGLQEYDDYKLLKRSGAKLPIDNLEFVDPIFEDEKDFLRIFYLAGPRHYMGCDGDDCAKAVDLYSDEELFLEAEPQNIYDKNAIKIINNTNTVIGYIPRYYAEGVAKLIKKGYSYTCKVFDVQKEKNCNECVRIKFEIKG